MSRNSNSSLLLFLLPEDQQYKGHENYASWETYMIAHGTPCGLVNYWENKVTIPNDPSQVNTPLAFSISSQLSIVIAFPSLTLTSLHLLTPNFLEHQLHESITMLSILINLIDIPGTGVNFRGKSHEAWKLLLDQYGKLSKRTRNMRE
jgi:hypothetical protein